MHKKNLKIALIAGEDSGDLLGSLLIKGLKALNVNIEFIGVGGDKMVASGLELINSNKEFAIMGIAEVFKKLPKLLKLRRQIITQIIAAKPDVFIGIDAPDLNFPIEKKLKRQGIKIIHYVSPSIWAWREKRVKWISRLTDLVLTLFPFEPKYYQKHDGHALFVGHPLAQDIEIKVDKKGAKRVLKLDENKLVLALLPGSRSNELKSHTAIFIKTALKLQSVNPNLQIVSANTNVKKIKYIEDCAQRNNLSITVFNDATKVLKAADLSLLASGTVALEAMLCKTPMVVGYQISKVTYGIVKWFNMMLLPYYSLPNVLYGDFLVPEILQKDMTVNNLFTELNKLMDSSAQDRMRKEFTQLHQNLLSPDMNAAKAVYDFLLIEAP